MAHRKPTYTETKAGLTRIQGTLKTSAPIATLSLAEGIEETLKLHHPRTGQTAGPKLTFYQQHRELEQRLQSPLPQRDGLEAIGSRSTRDFLKLGAAGGAALSLGAGPAAAQTTARQVAPSDKITLGFIGAGARAHGLMEAFKLFPEVEIVAACDAYAGRLERAKIRTDGRADTYKDYREIIQRADIDAVVISSPDHWHHGHSVDSLNAGKHAYIEKPMTWSIDEGLDIITAQQQNKVAVQVGSPSPSGILIKKARQLIKSGKIGQVTMLRAAVGIAQNLVGFRRLLPRWALKVDIFWQWIGLRVDCMGANGTVHANVGPIACSHADFRA